MSQPPPNGPWRPQQQHGGPAPVPMNYSVPGQYGPPQPQQGGPWQQPPMYGPPTGQPPARSGASAGRLPLIVALVVGLVVGAGVMTALALTGVVGSGKKSADTTPVALPTTLPGLVLQIDAMKELSGGSDRTATAQANLVKTRQATIDLLTSAYGGAAADVQFYSTPDIDTMSVVHAVRAPSPGLTIQSVQDAEYLQLAAPNQQVSTFDQVQCLVTAINTKPAGQTMDPEDLLPGVCQRSDDNLTVRVFSAGDTTTDEAVQRVNDVWKALS